MGVADASIVELERTPRKCDCRGLAKTSTTFDDPHLMSRAGLVPVMALAQRAGPGDLAGQHAAARTIAPKPRAERLCGKVPAHGRGTATTAIRSPRPVKSPALVV
jgi:hypothetical protein